MTKFKRLCHADQVPFTDQVRAQFRELTLTEIRKSSEEFFACDERENRIAQKFQLFVVLLFRAVFRRLQGLKLACLRTVSQRLIDQFGMLKVVSQLSFQCRNFSRFHVLVSSGLPARNLRGRELTANIGGLRYTRGRRVYFG